MSLEQTMKQEAVDLMELADCIDPAGAAQQVRLAAEGYLAAMSIIDVLQDMIRNDPCEMRPGGAM